MGRLVRDPEVKIYDEGLLIAKYTLAVDRMGETKSADFIPCVAFRKSGEFAEKHFFKGMRVLVEGNIQTGSYTNREGQKVYTTHVIVEKQEFADGKREQKPDEGFMDIPNGAEDEGLPFN